MKSISTGAKPTARARRDSRDRVPPSSTMTALRRPSSRTRRIAASAPRAAQADDAVERPRQAEDAREPAGVVGLVRLTEHVGREHPLGQVVGAQGDERTAWRRRPARRCVGPDRRRGGPRGDEAPAADDRTRRPRGALPAGPSPGDAGVRVVVGVVLEVVGVVVRTVTVERAGRGGIRPPGGVAEQHVLVDGQRLDRAEVVRPRSREVRRLDAFGESAAHVRVARAGAARPPGHARPRAARAAR